MTKTNLEKKKKSFFWLTVGEPEFTVMGKIPKKAEEQEHEAG